MSLDKPDSLPLVSCCQFLSGYNSEGVPVIMPIALPAIGIEATAEGADHDKSAENISLERGPDNTGARTRWLRQFINKRA